MAYAVGVVTLLHPILVGPVHVHDLAFYRGPPPSVSPLPRAPRQAREKPSVTCLPPPPVAAAASAEPSLLPPPSSRPRRSTSEVQRRLAATPVVARRFGSRRKARPALLPTCPLRHPAAADDHERALAGAQNATRRTVAADNQLDIALASAGHALRAAPPSALTHIRVLSTSTTLTRHLRRGVRSNS